MGQKSGPVERVLLAIEGCLELGRRRFKGTLLWALELVRVEEGRVEVLNRHGKRRLWVQPRVTSREEGSLAQSGAELLGGRGAWVRLESLSDRSLSPAHADRGLCAPMESFSQ